MNGFRDMEVYDMEQALRLFCDHSTRSFLYEVWGAYQRIEVLKDELNKANAEYAKRGDLIAELNNRVQALDRMAEDRLARLRDFEEQYTRLGDSAQEQAILADERLMYIKELEEREGALEDRIHELETAYDHVDREYKATLEALEFEQGLAGELDETVRELDTLLKRNAVRDAQTIADRDEDVRKLKMQIIELEQRNERLNTIVEAKRGVGQ